MSTMMSEINHYGNHASSTYLSLTTPRVRWKGKLGGDILGGSMQPNSVADELRGCRAFSLEIATRRVT